MDFNTSTADFHNRRKQTQCSDCGGRAGCEVEAWETFGNLLSSQIHKFSAGPYIHIVCHTYAMSTFTPSVPSHTISFSPILLPSLSLSLSLSVSQKTSSVSSPSNQPWIPNPLENTISLSTDSPYPFTYTPSLSK